MGISGDRLGRTESISQGCMFVRRQSSNPTPTVWLQSQHRRPTERGSQLPHSQLPHTKNKVCAKQNTKCITSITFLILTPTPWSRHIIIIFLSRWADGSPEKWSGLLKVTRGQTQARAQATGLGLWLLSRVPCCLSVGRGEHTSYMGPQEGKDLVRIRALGTSSTEAWSVMDIVTSLGWCGLKQNPLELTEPFTKWLSKKLSSWELT